MPARTTNGAAAPATTKANGKRFELPALEFKFNSLTEGTNIPPPPPSPIKDEPSATDAREKKKGAGATAEENKENGGAASSTTAANGNGTVMAGTKRPADDASSPLSPALSSRQGSIRRLFSRNLLNNTYAEGEAGSTTAVANGHANGSAARPSSRSNTSILDEKKAKRGSGWFRRLRDGPNANKRSSQLFVEEAKKPAGPPPPMIPELSALEAKVDVNDDGSLGADEMFKNIK